MEEQAAPLDAETKVAERPHDHKDELRLWLRLKADWFWDFFARTHEELTERLCTALKSFIDAPSKTASVCSIRK